GVYATDAQVTLTPEGAHHLTTDIADRLDDAVAALLAETQRPPPVAPFGPIAFADVRCSV
ncbi:MAG TPA: FMN reductase (NADPH), partial [Ramlibacter sp.]|nr:FMN reductase (NADPH) [Ramlibacter sp.]